MKTNSLLTASFFGLLLSCLGMAFLPSKNVYSQGSTTGTLPALPKPAADTIPTPAIIDRIAEKTEELKDKTKTISRNSRANEKQAGKLDKMVDQLATTVKDCPECPLQPHDTVLVEAPAKGTFFQRLGDIFRRK